MLNRILIMGRLVAEPEMRITSAQKPVTSYTLAVDRDFSNGGTRQTDFINCVSWNQGAEFVSTHFHKGQMMALSGRLQSRKWEDRDGNKRTDWEVVADNVYFCGDKPKTEAPNVFTDLSDEDGEVPF